MLSNIAQPFDKSGYSTFIAESASIGNEMLLNDYMVEHASSRRETVLLGLGLDQIRSTFFARFNLRSLNCASTKSWNRDTRCRVRA